MGSIGNLIDKARKNFRRPGRHQLSPQNVIKLIKARDKKFLEIMNDYMGVSTAGLIDADNNIDQQALKGRMRLAGVRIKNITEHADPRDNGIVFFKNGVAEIAMSQPFVDDNGRIKIKIVEPKFLIKGMA